jgi:integrase
VQFELTDQTRELVAAWIAHPKLRSEGFLFPSRGSQLPQLTTRQHARLVNRRVAMVGPDPADCGAHTLRRQRLELGGVLPLRNLHPRRLRSDCNFASPLEDEISR